ncbi:MAG: cupin domain-containing protein [Alphaproteobacteria bacterium]|nr:MAG: cupin domain-containing protein [Alphaproteobacteria bacterium]
MQKRLIRYGDMRPCTNAFIDTRTPGSDKKENFCLIGPGVAEQPGQHVHVRIPHGFNIGGARQPKGCVNSQHSHETEEVFLIHRGQWAFRWGHDAKDGEVVLGPGDVISIPVHVFRGFENIGDDDEAFLFSILGGDDPGHVTWAPYVFEAAKGHGLVLLEDGTLIDTTIGQTVPAGAREQAPTTMADVARHRRMSADEMLACVQFEKDFAGPGDSALARRSVGVKEHPIIGAANPAEGIGAGKLDWPHGFHFRRLELAPGAHVPPHARAEEEVLFVHAGAVKLQWDGKALLLGKGDTLTVPKGLVRSLANGGDGQTAVYVVRGTNAPAAPAWQA